MLVTWRLVTQLVSNLVSKLVTWLVMQLVSELVPWLVTLQASKPVRHLMHQLWTR